MVQTVDPTDVRIMVRVEPMFLSSVYHSNVGSREPTALPESLPWGL